jgi:hypothetical protein
MAFQIAQGMYWITRVVLGATNSVSAFVRVCRKILKAFLRSNAEILVNEVGMRCPQSWYGNNMVDELAGVQRLLWNT